MNLQELADLRKRKGFISIDSFNLELLEQLKNEGTFTVNEYQGKQNDTFEIMLNFVKQDYDLTEKQKKLYNFILMSQIIPILDAINDGSKKIAEVDKPHCDTCTCFDQIEDNELSDKAKLLQQSNEKLESEIDEDDLPF